MNLLPGEKFHTGTRTVEIFVPELGKRLNEIMREVGWRVYKGVCANVSKALMVAGVHRIEQFERPVELWFFPRLGPKRRAFDPTNYVVVVKAIEDRLVERGVLRGDSGEFVYGVHLMRPLRADDGIEGMLVRIVELDLPVAPMQAAIELEESAPF